MKIFLSWSGARSRAVAEALNDWLPRVIQAVRPFFSPEIEKGANWSSQIDHALEGTRFGIICLTRDNLRSEWIHYETGALSKTPDALVWTFLLDVEKGDVKPPLGKFQHTAADHDDVRDLIRTINRRLADSGGEPLRDAVLDETFEDLWPRLQRKLNAASELTSGDVAAGITPRRELHDMMEEMLEILRSQQRGGSAIPLSRLLSPDYLVSRDPHRVKAFYVESASPAFAAELRQALVKAGTNPHIDQFARADGTVRVAGVLEQRVPREFLDQAIAVAATATGEPLPQWRLLPEFVRLPDGSDLG